MFVKYKTNKSTCIYCIRLLTRAFLQGVLGLFITIHPNSCYLFQASKGSYSWSHGICMCCYDVPSHWAKNLKRSKRLVRANAVSRFEVYIHSVCFCEQHHSTSWWICNLEVILVVFWKSKNQCGHIIGWRMWLDWISCCPCWARVHTVYGAHCTSV